MAEALLRKHAGDRFELYSAGFESTDINPFTRQVMEEAGLDPSGQYAKGVKEYPGKIIFAYVIIVCARAEKTCPTAFPSISQQRLFLPFEDPVAVEGTEEESWPISGHQRPDRPPDMPMAKRISLKYRIGK
jgi:arsenate reductase